MPVWATVHNSSRPHSRLLLPVDLSSFCCSCCFVSLFHKVMSQHTARLASNSQCRSCLCFSCTRAPSVTIHVSHSYALDVTVQIRKRAVRCYVTSISDRPHGHRQPDTHLEKGTPPEVLPSSNWPLYVSKGAFFKLLLVERQSPLLVLPSLGWWVCVVCGR